MGCKGLDMLKKIWFVIFILSIPHLSEAEIYKWKDDSGVTRYSDQPPTTNIPYQPMKTQKPASGAATIPALTDSNGNSAVSGNPPAIKSKDAEDKSKTSDQVDSNLKGKEKACANSKTNLEKLKAGGTIYKVNSKGEREYLDDTTIKQEIEATQKEIDITCK